MTKTAFIQRLEARKTRTELKANILFGLVFGWLLLLVGLFRAYILLEGPAWRAAAFLGLVLLALSLVLPDALGGARKKVTYLSEKVAEILLRATLLLVYFCAIVPVATLSHDVKQSKLFREWSGEQREDFEGWVDKVTTDEGAVASGKNRSAKLVFRPLYIIRYFLRYGKAILLPSLTLLLVLALVGIFVESTSLAPLIYTIF